MAVDTPAPDRIPRFDVDFSALDDRLEQHAEAIWTTLLRAYESDRVNWSAEDVEAGWLIWLTADRNRLLSADELADLETFECALVRQLREGKRDPDRAFENLNAVEHSFVRILQRGISRQMERTVTEGPEQDPDPEPEVTE